MRYEKGSFVVIPNKQHLKGRQAGLQSIYFWLCEHANDDGISFPSRKTLANESGVSLRVIDKYLMILEEEKFLKKIVRKNGKENLTNLYQILIKNSNKVVAESDPPSSKSATTPSSKSATVTISNSNSNYLTENHSEYESLKKNKGLVKQKIRINHINAIGLPHEDEIEDMYQDLLSACVEIPRPQLLTMLRMYGI